MTREELNLKLLEIESKYQDKDIITPEGKIHIYYIFEAGQERWERRFDKFFNSEENFKEARHHILDTFGYLERDSCLIPIKKCYLVSNKEENIFKFGGDK